MRELLRKWKNWEEVVDGSHETLLLNYRMELANILSRTLSPTRSQDAESNTNSATFHWKHL